MAFFMSERSQNERLRIRMADAVSMPKDVVLGVPIVTLTGQVELFIENYRGILEYTETLIRVQTREGQIRVFGDHLLIAYYTNDEMKVTGQIQGVEYQ